nr:nuclear transport factor 2 family protein [Cellulomonas sp. IC4_254]
MAELRAVEDRRRRALVAVDLAELDALFDDALVHIHSPGLTHDKPQLLAHVAERRAFVDITRGPLDVRVLGDVALVVGTLTNRMRTPAGEVTLTGVATQVLRRTGAGRWRFLHFQLTPTSPGQ